MIKKHLWVIKTAYLYIYWLTRYLKYIYIPVCTCTYMPSDSSDGRP